VLQGLSGGLAAAVERCPDVLPPGEVQRGGRLPAVRVGLQLQREAVLCGSMWRLLRGRGGGSPECLCLGCFGCWPSRLPVEVQSRLSASPYLPSVVPERTHQRRALASHRYGRDYRRRPRRAVPGDFENPERMEVGCVKGGEGELGHGRYHGLTD
jgi:hypothetical protein